jgi:hypothetical protein
VIGVDLAADLEPIGAAFFAKVGKLVGVDEAKKVEVRRAPLLKLQSPESREIPILAL